MENILKKIIEIEYKAQGIKGEGTEERKRAFIEAEANVARIKEEISLSLQKSIEGIKEEKQREARQESERLEMEAEKKIRLMRKEFDKNRDLWVRDIFNDIIYGG